MYQLVHEETAYGYFWAVVETGVPEPELELGLADAGVLDVAVAVAVAETVAAVVVAVVVAVVAGPEEAV